MADKKGTILKRLIAIRNDLRAAEEIAKKHKEKYDELAQQLIAMMKDDDTESTGNDAATASIRKTVVAQVTDWEKFYRYIHKNKAFYLIQKRVSDAAWRETLEGRKNRPIPGTEPFTKIGLNLRVKAK